MQLRCERTSRFEVVAEGLLDDDARGLRKPCFGETLHHAPEEKRRDLEIEDRKVSAFDRLSDAPVRRVVCEVAGNVGEACGEALEDLFVELLARADDRIAG